jgi:membrane protein DedA with SNARE-associated domain
MVVSIPAGFAEMPLRRFLLWSVLGIGIWCAALAWIGERLGDAYHDVARYVGPVTWAVLAGFLLWWIVLVVRRRRARKKT